MKRWLALLVLLAGCSPEAREAVQASIADIAVERVVMCVTTLAFGHAICDRSPYDFQAYR